MDNKHNEFAKSLRKIIRDNEKETRNRKSESKVVEDDEARDLQKYLEKKFTELFGPVDKE